MNNIEISQRFYLFIFFYSERHIYMQQQKTCYILKYTYRIRSNYFTVTIIAQMHCKIYTIQYLAGPNMSCSICNIFQIFFTSSTLHFLILLFGNTCNSLIVSTVCYLLQLVNDEYNLCNLTTSDFIPELFIIFDFSMEPTWDFIWSLHTFHKISQLVRLFSETHIHFSASKVPICR